MGDDQTDCNHEQALGVGQRPVKGGSDWGDLIDHRCEQLGAKVRVVDDCRERDHHDEADDPATR